MEHRRSCEPASWNGGLIPFLGSHLPSVRNSLSFPATFALGRSLTGAMASRKPDDAKSKLLHDYAAATKHHAWAVGELNKQRAVLPVDHFQRCRRSWNG